MDASVLRAWCEAKRGRVTTLALALGVSKMYVSLMARGERAITDKFAVLIEHEIRRSERMGEAK